jgi:hypothetical protein
MDLYEKIGYSLLAIIVALYLVAMFAGIIATLPYGLVGLALVGGIGVLMAKVVIERLRNKEDDHYSEKVDK